METYEFEDALVAATVTCSYPGLETVRARHEQAVEPCTSLFFPGCSFINYGMPLVKAVYDLLVDAGSVDGISLLCCSKILEYDPDALEAREQFVQQLRSHIADAGIERIVTACPNCVETLRKLLSDDQATAQIEVVPLSVELAELGYRIDSDTALHVARQDPRLADAESILFCAKDSCPDRKTGEFADALRTLLPEGAWVDPEHNRKKSVCCGSRPRAIGNMDAALRSCRMNHEEAKAAGANALATSCMSCTFLLSTLNSDLPVFHYLELLFDYRVPWEYSDQYMKLRFLFDSSLGAREFFGLAEEAE